MDVLGLISTFIRVVENGSIAAAARAKGMSPAAVSQSLSRLEAHLGVRLLSRTTRSMTLTENGKRYFEKVRHIPHDIELASQAAANETKPQGHLYRHNSRVWSVCSGSPYARFQSVLPRYRY